ncbi:uncharacterized protein HMPREF1541_06372 [Cyphellophora europaea CBS 101466]|uniref:Mitochondrial pyruvate carrier n=1 Tax=Cyphellophora europaea (strain CBS 101466) TaxID=1220924 RepID=W2RPD5_CYPE1|nr:uncharacterized protein HMPREF1541_06372 [Cyphellophora europaea CBS 101466]ETN38337.1 hypothetical protein HMPREF1541_06372 [Cyphellophora europaea CBS 101466]
MAAAIKAINAKIRSNKALDYFCSTHFWGPASNFGIPLAAIADMKKDPEIISGPFTASLAFYSGTFMRYSMAVTPKNYLLFACHFINFNSQLVQGYRWYDYWYMGGKTNSENLKLQAEGKASELETKAEGALDQAKQTVQKGVEEAKKKVS